MGIEQLHMAANIPQLVDGESITNLMYAIWCSRKDLQIAFDISTKDGQEAFLAWFKVSVTREYGISAEVAQQSEAIMNMESVLRNFGKRLPASIRKLGRELWNRHLAHAARKLAKKAKNELVASKTTGDVGKPGANLIGYAHAELGMGEHVRMSAAALNTTDIPFGVLNFDVGVSSRKKASLDHGESIAENRYSINVFHINADQMISAYCHFGVGFFTNRYNIGYWAWELSKCPKEWVPVIEMVDEIWAPSRFIQSAFAEKTSKPVEYMPLCVSLQSFQARGRVEFKLPENYFLFLFVFDFHSYIERKNPFAAIKAFQLAFPDRSSQVGLVIKVMNGNLESPEWVRMMVLIDDDPRIHIINRTMSRGEVLALIDSCDCFVSLHRSEGFGRGPAEAMLLGKPVIVTNYSGNIDFTRPDNSLLVNYHLIPVETGQYVFGDEQVWADADVEHAAWHMKRLMDKPAIVAEIGLRGKDFIRTNYNQSAVGAIYAKRLKVILRS